MFVVARLPLASPRDFFNDIERSIGMKKDGQKRPKSDMQEEKDPEGT
jgi:hypothetical protein